MESVPFQIWVVLPFLVHLASGSPIMSLDVPLLEEDLPFFDEQDAVLQNWQDQLLKALNFSDISLQETTKVDPPEYMLELYNRFATDKSPMPSANIVRSFQNEEHNSRPIHFNGVWRYPLLFNVSIPHYEKITLAELRLYTLAKDRLFCGGPKRKVTIFEVLEKEHGGQNGEQRRRKVLASTHICSTDNEWKTFEVTEAIRKWHRSDFTTHRLEVQFESRAEDETGRGGEGDIDINAEAKHGPLLVVFSDDHRHAKEQEEEDELNEMMEHERVPGLGNSFLNSPSVEKLLQISSNIIYDSTSRIRRNAKGGSCKKASLHVDFKEIGWDSWIIAPQGYDAFQCVGECPYPLDKQHATTHAVLQTAVHLHFPERSSRACCVPIKLAPISLLYIDKGIVTFKAQYEDMVVAECGCR